MAVGLFGGGFLLFGIAMCKAAMMPKWAVILFVTGSVVGPQGFLPVAVATIAFLTMGVGLAGLGVALWADPEASEPHPHSGATRGRRILSLLAQASHLLRSSPSHRRPHRVIRV